MPLQLTNVVKAQVSQAILSALLERGGYRVTRLGIEELFAEIKYLDLPDYMALNLPLELRYLPDLLVADLEMKNAYLVEVKFRRRFDEGSANLLCKELSKQREHWPTSYAVIMIAEPFLPEGRFHQDYIRVVPPKQTHRLVNTELSPEKTWESLPQIYHVFRGLDDTSHLLAADSITPALRDLAKLQERP